MYYLLKELEHLQSRGASNKVITKFKKKLLSNVGII